MSRKRRCFNYANHCLEKWVIWNTEHNGFPSRSPILKLGEMAAFSSASSIPTGVETNDRDVERANTVLSMMSGSSNKSAERAHLLKVVGVNRQENESVYSTMQRVGITTSERSYYDALEEFDIRLETINHRRA